MKSCCVHYCAMHMSGHTDQPLTEMSGQCTEVDNGRLLFCTLHSKMEKLDVDGLMAFNIVTLR